MRAGLLQTAGIDNCHSANLSLKDHCEQALKENKAAAYSLISCSIWSAVT